MDGSLFQSLLAPIFFCYASQVEKFQAHLGCFGLITMWMKINEPLAIKSHRAGVKKRSWLLSAGIPTPCTYEIHLKPKDCRRHKFLRLTDTHLKQTRGQKISCRTQNFCPLWSWKMFFFLRLGDKKKQPTEYIFAAEKARIVIHIQ